MSVIYREACGVAYGAEWGSAFNGVWHMGKNGGESIYLCHRLTLQALDDTFGEEVAGVGHRERCGAGSSLGLDDFVAAELDTLGERRTVGVGEGGAGGGEGGEGVGEGGG